MMEASKDGTYKIVDHWSPEVHDPVHVLGIMLMIDLAQFKLVYREVY